MPHPHRVALLLLLSVAALAAPPAPGAHGTAHTLEVDLAYWIYGASSSATPIIVINGGPGLSHIYMLQNDTWPRLAHTRQVVFYDQRGLGASTRLTPNASQTIAAQVADLEALRAHLGFPQVDLAGDSFGGFIAMAYAAAHPDHLRKLILSDTAPPDLAHLRPLLGDAFPDVEAHTKEAATHLTDPKAIADADLRAHFRMIFYSPELRDRYLAGVHDLGFSAPIGDAVGKSAEALDLTPTLPRLHAPTLVLNGRFDLNTTPLGAWTIAHTIPGAQIVFFEHSGHLPAYEEPDRYVTVVDTFLRDRHAATAK